MKFWFLGYFSCSGGCENFTSGKPQPMVNSKFDFPTCQMTYIDSRSRMSRRLQNAEISDLLVIEVGMKRDLEILVPTFWPVFVLVTRFFSVLGRFDPGLCEKLCENFHIILLNFQKLLRRRLLHHHRR